MDQNEADTPRQKAERLLTAVDQAAGHGRSLFLFFLLAATYIGVIIGSTTDVQLLKGRPVTLPVLDIELPLFWFYALAPWVVLLFHFNFLLQLYLLADKLRSLNWAIGSLESKEAQLELRKRIYPFVFCALGVGTHHAGVVRFFLRVLFFLTVVVLPLSLLIWALLQFLPYHHPKVTGAQQAAVLVDLVQLWVFLPLIRSPNTSIGRKHRPQEEGAEGLQPNPRWSLASIGREGVALMQAGLARGLGGLVMITLLVGGIVFSIPPLPPRAQPAPSEFQREDRFGGFVDWMFFRKNDFPDESLFSWLPPSPFSRHLKPSSEAILVAGKPADQHLVALKGGTLDERTRALKHLRGLDLAEQDLRGAFLLKARLPNADLWHALLQGANLYNARLQGAFLEGARLQGANLDGAWLQGAILKEVDFKAAQLQGAHLRNANLQDAILKDAQLQGADLRDANLRNIQSWKAIGSLAGANLYGVRNPPEGFMDWAIQKKQAVCMADHTKWVSLRRQVEAREPSREAAWRQTRGVTRCHIGRRDEKGVKVSEDYGKPMEWHERAVKSGHKETRGAAWLLAPGGGTFNTQSQ